MKRSQPVGGFALAYDRRGRGPAVIALHGWPGDRHDWRMVDAELGRSITLITPDLRGFGQSGHASDSEPADVYGAAGQAASVLALIDELSLGPVVLAGYDVGSRVAQQVARTRPQAVRALVLAPPLPGAGPRVQAPGIQGEYWYQAFHQLALAERLVDGKPDAARAYLEHFWSHWSGPDFDLAAAQLDRLTEIYGVPGAFTASIGWYRAGSGTVAVSAAEGVPDLDARIAAPTTVLWPEHDPLFPSAWADRVEWYFSDVTVRPLPGVGHFSPLEAPDRFAAAIRAAAASG